jgi:hypothetical protein
MAGGRMVEFLEIEPQPRLKIWNTVLSSKMAPGRGGIFPANMDS